MESPLVIGPDIGAAHARTAIGVATAPLNLPLVVSFRQRAGRANLD